MAANLRTAMVAKQRLTKEYRSLVQDPLPNVHTAFDPADLFTMYFVIEGHVEEPDIRGGYYFGRIVFPPTYPSAAPSIYMTTPNGFFEPDQAICMSMTAYHPETWNPSWGPRSILLGFVSFIEEILLGKDCAAGCIWNRDPAVIKQLAAGTLKWNVAQDKFKTFFPKLVELHAQKQ